MAPHSIFLLGEFMDRGALWATVRGVRVEYDLVTKQQQNSIESKVSYAFFTRTQALGSFSHHVRSQITLKL